MGQQGEAGMSSASEAQYLQRAVELCWQVCTGRDASPAGYPCESSETAAASAASVWPGVAVQADPG